MSQKRYFKDGYASERGQGIGYWEYIDNFCTRQIEAFSERIELYRQEIGHYNKNMVDHLLTENTFRKDSEISQSEFESVWAKGIEVPNSTRI